MGICPSTAATAPFPRMDMGMGMGGFRILLFSPARAGSVLAGWLGVGIHWRR